MFEKLKIISLSVHRISFSECLDQVIGFAFKRSPAYVCFANVHMVIEAHNDKNILHQVENADLVLPDGKPLAIACKMLYGKKQERISGMDFTPLLLEKANENRFSIFVYGSTENIITAFKEMIYNHYPAIHFAGAISPPFRPLTDDEIMIDIEKINRAGANIVLVSLGCPKEGKWMSKTSGKINSVLIGIGGALPVVAGVQKRAPRWMQNMALEWFYRLLQQPGRLFTRYLYTNSYFLFLLSRDYIKSLFKR
jgi:N-acetylglucosaminyldiphosphoundecaprenol N-acetyl-beta-D-mannosaminyltransferase